MIQLRHFYSMSPSYCTHLSPSGTLVSHPASQSPSPSHLHCQIHTHFIPTRCNTPSAQLCFCSTAPFSFLSPLLNCLCFIECRCDYMGFCVCLTGVKGILSQIFPLYLCHTNTYTETNANTYTRTQTRTQHKVSSPLQRDVLLIGLSLVTVWEDDLSRRFLCRVVTGTSVSRE